MLFKFISERPSSSFIWQTLDDTAITPSAGYTVHQIKFMMFIILVMHDFKEAKQICNDFLESKPAPIFTTIKKYLDVSDSDIKSILEPPADLPSFVDAPLYEPYYMLMQLKVPFNSPLWLEPFNRQTLENEEIKYISTNYLSINYSITIYKIWQYNLYASFDLDSIYADTFTIDTSLPPVPVKVKSDIHAYLRVVIHDVVDEKIIYDYSEKIIIPPFRLVQEESNEAQ